MSLQQDKLKVREVFWFQSFSSFGHFQVVVGDVKCAAPLYLLMEYAHFYVAPIT